MLSPVRLETSYILKILLVFCWTWWNDFFPTHNNETAEIMSLDALWKYCDSSSSSWHCQQHRLYIKKTEEATMTSAIGFGRKHWSKNSCLAQMAFGCFAFFFLKPKITPCSWHGMTRAADSSQMLSGRVIHDTVLFMALHACVCKI